MFISVVEKSDPPEYFSRIDRAFSDISAQVEWVKKHVPDEFEGCSLNEIISLYRKYEPLFGKIKKEADEQQRLKIEEEILNTNF
jgi:hypothetical protein